MLSPFRLCSLKNDNVYISGWKSFAGQFLLWPDLRERVRVEAAEHEEWTEGGEDPVDKTLAFAQDYFYFYFHDPDIEWGEEIESRLYLHPLHLSSSALSTSPLVIYLLQHGFSAY